MPHLQLGQLLLGHGAVQVLWSEGRVSGSVQTLWGCGPESQHSLLGAVLHVFAHLAEQLAPEGVAV